MAAVRRAEGSAQSVWGGYSAQQHREWTKSQLRARRLIRDVLHCPLSEQEVESWVTELRQVLRPVGLALGIHLDR